MPMYFGMPTRRLPNELHFEQKKILIPSKVAMNHQMIGPKKVSKLAEKSAVREEPEHTKTEFAPIVPNPEP